MILPVCSVRRVWCREDGSVWSWWAFSAGNNPLEEDNRFLFLSLYPLITKWMHCHTWLMGPVAYHGPWSICEHFNSNTENCMSKYQRVMPRALAFSAERGYPFLAHICQKHFLTAIRSHSDAIYSTSSSPKAFVPTALLPLFCFYTLLDFFFLPQIQIHDYIYMDWKPPSSDSGLLITHVKRERRNQWWLRWVLADQIRC